MRRREYIMQRILWFFIVLLAGYLLARGYLYVREHPTKTGENILKRGYREVGEQVASCYFPVCFYDDQKKNRFLEQDPLHSYLKELEPEEVVMEDESTCHEVMEKGGQTITERLLAENQKKKEETLPSWATVAQVEPIKDLSMERLGDFQYLINNFFVIDPNTTIENSRMDAKMLLGKDMKLQNKDAKPQVLIYHTHATEAYADSIEGDENTSVVGVGNYLESLLREVFGYEVLHIKDPFDLMGGQLDRSKAYNYALPALEEILNQYPSIEVVIDLHRDGVPEGKRLVTEINGKPTAQVMFFNGLSYTVERGTLEALPNPYTMDNLAFSFQLSYQAAKYYPHLTRCIYLKGYRYNLHLRPKSLLLEVGAQTNTVEEAKNAMEPFSVILNKVLKGE